MRELDPRKSYRCGPVGLEAQHRPAAALDRPVVLLDDIVQVLAVANQDVYPPPIFSTEPAQRPMALLVPVECDPARPPWRARCDRLAEKGHRRSDSPPELSRSRHPDGRVGRPRQSHDDHALGVPIRPGI